MTLETPRQQTVSDRRSTAWRWRFAFAATVLAVYLLLVLYPWGFRLIGVTHEFGWFFDSLAILASNDAKAAGIDPHAVNPLDMLGRPHVYTHWWLWLSDLGMTRRQNFLLGGAFAGLFFAGTFAWLGPRNAREFGCYLLVAVSTPVVLAVERGNNDLVVFALMVATAMLLADRREWMRWCALVPVMMAVGLKFYPAMVAPVLLAGESRREILARLAVVAAMLAMLYLDLRADLAALDKILPRPVGLLSLGAPQAFTYWGVSDGVARWCGLILGGVALAACRPWKWCAEWSEPRELQREWLAFVLGATLLVGCFFAGSNFAYRLVFCLLMLPFLCRMGWGDPREAGARRLARVLLGLVVAVVWVDGLVLSALTCFAGRYSEATIYRWADAAAFARQPLMWALVVSLGCFLTVFIGEVATKLGVIRSMRGPRRVEGLADFGVAQFEDEQ